MCKLIHDQGWHNKAWRPQCIQSGQIGYASYTNWNTLLCLSWGLERRAIRSQGRHLEFRMCDIRNDYPLTPFQSSKYEGTLFKSSRWELWASAESPITWFEKFDKNLYLGETEWQTRLWHNFEDARIVESHYRDTWRYLSTKGGHRETTSNYSTTYESRYDNRSITSSLILEEIVRAFRVRVGRKKSCQCTKT